MKGASSPLTLYHSCHAWLLRVALLCLIDCVFQTESFVGRQTQVWPLQSNKGVALPATGDQPQEPNNNQQDDWRAVRARLVGQSTFETGSVIEKGSLLVSLVEDTLGCHDLHQPYLHKAVVLLLEHEPQEFTQGILLNRPTDLVLSNADILYDGRAVGEDEEAVVENLQNERNDTAALQWPVYFGGDLAGPLDDTRQAMILCLHRMKNISDERLRNASDEVMPGLGVTSHATAAQSVAEGSATADDFFTFYGFCGWEPGQLQKELARGSWVTVTTTTGVLWEQLQRQRATQADPRAAGLDQWQFYVNAMGRDARRGQNAFGDLMLKAWTSEYLCLARSTHHSGDDFDEALVGDDRVQHALSLSDTAVAPGRVVRATTPFLLYDQYLHKSLILVLADSETATVGLILNLPLDETYTLVTPAGRSVEFAIRFGGDSSRDRASEPLLWLHCSPSLRKLGIGQSLNLEWRTKICQCTPDQVAEAIDLGLALPREFLVVQGFVVWEKRSATDGAAGGLLGEMRAGRFESVATTQLETMWILLQGQEVLSRNHLEQNLQTALSAWTVSGLGKDSSSNSITTRNDQTLVYDSDVSVGDLADVALGVWITIFLLGDATYAPSQ